MKLPFAIWYLRNGHMISHPSIHSTDKKGTIYVYMMAEDNIQLLYFVTTTNSLIQKIKEYGEAGYIKYILKRNLAYVANEFPLELYGWNAPMQYMRFSEYEKLQRRIANDEIQSKKNYKRGRIPSSLYLDELISLAMESKNPLNIQRAVIDDFRDGEFLKIQYKNSKRYEGIRISLSNELIPNQDIPHPITSRDIVFRWKLHQ